MPDLMLQTSRAPTGTLKVTSPFDGRELAQLPTAAADYLDDALSVAHVLFRDKGAWPSVPKRLAVLNKCAEIMQEQIEELTLLAASECGKPYRDSRVEVIRAIDGVHLCAEALRAHPGHVIPIGTTPATAGRTAFTHKGPIGVVAAVSAFNHPLNLIVHQVGPAIAAGCPVVVKPTAGTPLSCVRFVEILREAELPNEWCQVLITDDLGTAEALVTDERLGFFSFIGSARVGWMLRSKLAPGVRCALEHGGAAPVVIAPPYDRNAALAAIAKGGFYHAGQVCVSVQRVFVPRAEVASFAEALAGEADKLVFGRPEDENTDVGPLIREAEGARVAEWVDEAVASGAKLLSGGKTLPNNGYAATVLLDASAVMINDHSAFRDDVMPFAGLRQSGLGVDGIPYTFEDMTIEKMMVVKSS